MSFIKIAKHQELKFETFLVLKNSTSTITLACQNSLLLNHYEYVPTSTNPTVKPHDDKSIMKILGYMFSHELVQFFGSKIPGGLFEIIDVTSSQPTDNGLAYVDIGLETNANENSTSCARFYGTPLVIDSVNKHILEKTILTNINKVTGYPVYTNDIKIDSIYKINFLDKIRTLQARLPFLKCSYLIENNVVDFYFPEKIVCHFSSLLLRNSHSKMLNFNTLLGKIFAELFLNTLEAKFHVFAKIISVNVQYVKDKDFLEFNLESVHNRFEFFSDVKNKLFLLKLLQAANFKPIIENSTKPNLQPLNFPFSVEIGVSYLSQAEYKNLTEGDIIVFDKTCLSTDTPVVDKCVINLNGMSLIASITESSCQVTHFTKDW
ncbi:MAG: hypothetical protein V4591_08095 [Bdellovibrionota bacterium]